MNTIHFERADELKHYGVIGMKWGHRKAQQYRNAAQAERKFARTADPRHAKVQLNAKQQVRAQKEYKSALNNAKRLDAKAAKYEKKVAASQDKRDIKKLSKSMYKSGMPGSVKDIASNNRSSVMYDQIRKQKGKEYADKVVLKTRNRAYRDMATSAAVTAGAIAASAYLRSKR